MEVITKFFILALCFAATSADVNEIPQRCIENSVTPVSCNVPLGDDRLLPHPDDCQLFYYCVNTDQQPICRQCPAGLHFNPTKKVCDFPGIAGCNVGAQASFSLDERDIDPICENPDPNWPYADSRPNPDDCTKYYVCDWGVAIPMSCPDGLHFSGRYCTWPHAANCKVSP